VHYIKKKNNVRHAFCAPFSKEWILFQRKQKKSMNRKNKFVFKEAPVSGMHIAFFLARGRFLCTRIRECSGHRATTEDGAFDICHFRMWEGGVFSRQVADMCFV